MSNRLRVKSNDAVLEAGDIVHEVPVHNIDVKVFDSKLDE